MFVYDRLRDRGISIATVKATNARSVALVP
jgi:hypothetical protein